ncbi:MAG: hypothetical protein J6333_02675 [Planctomycetes bacterium]|nr:hypothetical protein [Planctomycetota bacterium]
MQLSFAARAVMNPAMMLAGQRQAGEVEFGGLVDMGVNLVGGHSWHGGSSRKRWLMPWHDPL